MQQRSEHEQAAYELGVEHAKNAASWIVDGNTSQERYREVLKWIEEGEAAGYGVLPSYPNLSGELTPISLYESITGLDHTTAGSVVDVLAEAYEAGVANTFEDECERILRAAVA